MKTIRGDFLSNCLALILLCAPAPPVQAAGRLISWGSDANGQIRGTPSGSDFIAVSEGLSFSLALRSDGTIAAWGDDTYGAVRNAPRGDGFIQIEAGDNHAVALRADGSIVAWGLDNYGQVSTRPDGTGFVKVAAGGFTAWPCGRTARWSRGATVGMASSRCPSAPFATWTRTVWATRRCAAMARWRSGVITGTDNTTGQRAMVL